MELASKYNPADVEGKWYQYWLDNKLFSSKPDGREPYTVFHYSTGMIFPVFLRNFQFYYKSNYQAQTTKKQDICTINQ